MIKIRVIEGTRNRVNTGLSSPPRTPAICLCFGKTQTQRNHDNVIRADFSKGFGIMFCEKLLIQRRWEVVWALGQRVGFAEMKTGYWRTDP